MFLILAAKAPATVWEVTGTASGVIGNLAKKYSYVNHYSFHIMDPQWGHVTIKMSGHPPFAAQVMLNGHEFVACQARAAGIDFIKDGNCFTAVAAPNDLARVADTLSQPATTGRLSQVCNRWIYTACLCFGLDSDEVLRSGFGYAYSVYQVEYSRNLLFADGKRMQRLFDTVVDRTRSRLNVTRLRTMFGAKQRPHHDRAGGPPRLAAMIETPVYDLTNFKVHFGRLTLKAYTKGEHVLRFEAIVHNTKELNCRRGIDMFGEIVTRLAGMARAVLHRAGLRRYRLHSRPHPGRAAQRRRRSDATRVGGIDLNRPRMRNALAAVLALAAAPNGFTVTGFAEQVRVMTGQTTTEYSTRHASYDLRKIRGKHLVDKPGRTRRYHVPPDAARTIAALLTLRDQVIAPIIAGVRSPRIGRKPITWTPVDRDYETLRIDLQTLFTHLGITTTQRSSGIDNTLSIRISQVSRRRTRTRNAGGTDTPGGGRPLGMASTGQGVGPSRSRCCRVAMLPR